MRDKERRREKMGDDFTSGPLEGNSKWKVIAIVVVAIAALSAISWYTGLFAALS